MRTRTSYWLKSIDVNCTRGIAMMALNDDFEHLIFAYNTGTVRNGGYNLHKGHIPRDFLYNCDIPLQVQLRGEEDNDLRIFMERDQGKREGQYGMVWVLDVLISSVNRAVLNYRMKYCAEGWTPEFSLVLQQPEADNKGNRMNYVLNDYDSGLSWQGA